MIDVNTHEIVEVEVLILSLRGQRVILDYDLARLYGVPTKSLNQAVRRNIERFPEGFFFQLDKSEYEELLRGHARLSRVRFAKVRPLAFTDYGVAMLSSVLRSPRAVQINVRIIQAFVRMRRLAFHDVELRGAVSALSARVGEHDEAIRQLMRSLGMLGEAGDQLKSALSSLEPEKL